MTEERKPSKSRMKGLMQNIIVRRLMVLFACIAAFEYFTLPGPGIEGLRTENPAVTALMDQRTDEARDGGKPFHVTQRWVPLSKISQNLIHAVIVAEDGTFYEHGGFDWYELQESLERNLDEGRPVRGASTITQQLAKNLYLSTSKSPLRKIKEAIIALRLEEHLSKERILELYLNDIEWGDGVFGIGAAAQKYFGTSAGSLGREEAARLAAVIPSPLKHSPNISSRYVLRRSAIILRRMEARGW